MSNVTEGPVRVGVVPPGPSRGAEGLRSQLERIAAAGLDRVVMGDHVSFHGGFGVDGLVSAAVMVGAHPTLEVATGVYLLPLRHPVTVARQVSTIAQLAPGRFVFGVGIGGEDRREVAACGVDPASRGRRMDESLAILRRLLRGETVSIEGEFFQLEDVRILPAPDPPVPVLVGGRSDAALRRAGRLGDGWLAIWVSPARFAEGMRAAQEAASAAARLDYSADHALQVWCGFGATPAAGRAVLAPVMEAVYGLPFERFERWCPTGRPEAVAAFLGEYLEVGCRSFHLIPRAADPAAAIDAAGEVAELLRRSHRHATDATTKETSHANARL